LRRAAPYFTADDDRTPAGLDDDHLQAARVARRRPVSTSTRASGWSMTWTVDRPARVLDEQLGHEERRDRGRRHGAHL
jgi:hypothetical protein